NPLFLQGMGILRYGQVHHSCQVPVTTQHHCFARKISGPWYPFRIIASAAGGGGTCNQNYANQLDAFELLGHDSKLEQLGGSATTVQKFNTLQAGFFKIVLLLMGPGLGRAVKSLTIPATELQPSSG
ncbi:MAG TPA: hypothetical protein VE954_38730, partial [Oligoflexus sp.]|uniref:hypothetical protein n=1 Tax=Oligoflexus sp. TaxID=1971216 RepID=UPI002D2BF9FE